MKLKKLTKTIVTTLAVAILGFGMFGVNVNAEEHTHTGVAEPIPVYRLYNPNSGEHLYTKDINEKTYLDEIGCNYEGIAFTAINGGQHVYRLFNPYSGEHHYTKNTTEVTDLHTKGWNVEGVAWDYDYDGRCSSLYN